MHDHVVISSNFMQMRYQAHCDLQRGNLIISRRLRLTEAEEGTSEIREDVMESRVEIALTGNSLPKLLLSTNTIS